MQSILEEVIFEFEFLLLWVRAGDKIEITWRFTNGVGKEPSYLLHSRRSFLNQILFTSDFDVCVSSPIAQSVTLRT